jgi:hypothetical protein
MSIILINLPEVNLKLKILISYQINNKLISSQMKIFKIIHLIINKASIRFMEETPRPRD